MQDGVKEPLYANDRVLTDESKEEVTQILLKLICVKESKGLKVNMKNNKIMVSDSSGDEHVQSGRHHCVWQWSGSKLRSMDPLRPRSELSFQPFFIFIYTFFHLFL